MFYADSLVGPPHPSADRWLSTLVLPPLLIRLHVAVLMALCKLEMPLPWSCMRRTLGIIMNVVDGIAIPD